MAVSKVSCIGDLFEKDFAVKLFQIICFANHKKIFNVYKKKRLILIQQLYIGSTQISQNNSDYIYQNIPELPVGFISEICSNTKELDSDQYKQDIFKLGLRDILYHHYSFSIKKNKAFYKEYIKPIIDFYFRQDKHNILKNKQLLFYDMKTISDDKVRYLVIKDIFKSIDLINDKIVRQLKDNGSIVNYVCKKILGESLDANKQVETLLKSAASRLNTNIDTSNSAICGYYKGYIRDLDNIKENIGINDFIDADYDTRRLYMNNLDIDDIYLEEYLSSIKNDELSKPSRVIAYNILQYKYPELTREDIRKRCSRAENTPKQRYQTKLENLDLKILEYCNTVFYTQSEFITAFNQIKKLISSAK